MAIVEFISQAALRPASVTWRTTLPPVASSMPSRLLISASAEIGPADVAVALGRQDAPSEGALGGLSLDQAAIARDFPFPTVMVLPHQGLNTPAGVETGLRRVAETVAESVRVGGRAKLRLSLIAA